MHLQYIHQYPFLPFHILLSYLYNNPIFFYFCEIVNLTPKNCHFTSQGLQIFKDASSLISLEKSSNLSLKDSKSPERSNVEKPNLR